MYYKSKTRKRGKNKKLVKSRNYIKIQKYSKKRRSTYKYRNKTQHLRKKRTTLERRHSRRKMYGGEECQDQVDTVDKAKSAIASFPKGFKTFFDILEDCPEVIQSVSDEYKKKIQLKDDAGNSTGYLGLLGLQLINYLNARITKLRNQRDSGDNSVIPKIEILKTAISLMDQVAAAPGVGEGQLQTVKEYVDKKYYDCYVKLYNKLATKFDLKKRSIPLSTSACYFSQNCLSESEVCDDCCVPDNLDFTKRQNNTPTDQPDVEEPREKRQKT
jgi:hypothetical protein